MDETANNEGATVEPEKPVTVNEDVKFPPFPDPTDDDFDDDISEEEKSYYKNKFQDLNTVKTFRLHCTACDRHLGSSARNESRMRAHPMLRTLVCQTCHTFYNSGEFEKGDDGSELYCRWCGQGGQVYCCSDCPHVFCAKCIKRNLGVSKIKEIENADDWNCFKCKPDALKELRAVCWALLRYCDLKNKITYKTEDPELREMYQKDCAQDFTDCCKNKSKRKEKSDLLKKKDADNLAKKTAAAISKIPPTIQVKKFASINLEDIQKEKKPQKRSASPKNKPLILKSTLTAPGPRLLNPICLPNPVKKIRMSTPPQIMNAVRFDNRTATTYARIRPKPVPTLAPLPILNHFNGFTNTGIFNKMSNMLVSDNINLSLENLTQGLDMAAVAAMSNSNNNGPDDDVVCTPDFPMEPLCEVTEDNDDDVECITPGPVAAMANRNMNPPPLVPRGTPMPDLSSDNIIQMTENDVTVNMATGGLKFRVDPQTLSSKKMYRLPDGRVFAINANPNMPGGYSATIVAVTETTGKAVTPKGATYAAKLSAVPNSTPSTPTVQKTQRPQTRSSSSSKRSTPRTRSNKKQDNTDRECDLNVPVEWYRYNLIDAIDALEYSLSRLQNLKKETSTMFLRTRSVAEMRSLHRTLERLLNTSSSRFTEIRENLNKELKQYVLRKMGANVSEDDDDDDDVEILPDLENDDPIFIDENSMDSNMNDNGREVDLTGAGSSEHNESGDKNDEVSPMHNIDPLKFQHEDNMNTTDQNNTSDDVLDTAESHVDDNYINEFDDKEITIKKDMLELSKNEDFITDNKQDDIVSDESIKHKCKEEQTENKCVGNATKSHPQQINDNLTGKETIEEINGDGEKSNFKQAQNNETEITDSENKILNDKTETQDNEEKTQDSEMSEEMIETLLKDDTDSPSLGFDIPELQET